MKLMHKQQGMTLAGWLFVFVVGGFAVLCTLKMLPHYLDDMSIGRVLKNLDRPDIGSASPSEIRDLISRGFQVNSIRDIPNDAVKVKRQGGVVNVVINYEKREHLLANIYVVLTFEHNWNTQTK
ncbi:DUF4845 domain-containing protein [Zooshikella ganghwensis]|uniref:DUF4845 domain-containing protein n=1 Tax=Zooshikella ganghwensis TaxID=202772 RepID=UPI0004864572|nr:DUF4845 domain-containing protein [Zooshikella ganghwensis]